MRSIDANDMKVIEENILSKSKSVFIYGEDRDKGAFTVLAYIDKHFKNREILFLANRIADISKFEIGVKFTPKSNVIYDYGNNKIRFDNFQNFSPDYKIYDIIVAYPMDRLIIEKKNEKIAQVINANANKIVLLTEYNVSDVDLSFVIKNVDSVIEIKEKNNG